MVSETSYSAAWIEKLNIFSFKGAVQVAPVLFIYMDIAVDMQKVGQLVAGNAAGVFHSSQNGLHCNTWNINVQLYIFLI